MSLSPGTVINNRYRILSVLGQGGMGFVYQAEDSILSVSVAVKENLFLSEEYSRQFSREAKILAGLRHASLPHVSDYFTIPGQGQYLIMNYIEGEDLRERIERLGTLPVKDVIRIGVAVCDALHYLHTREETILHRDIKPGNIKITPEGNLVLVDFGLAKIMRGNQATTDGARAMTPGYSPPEQYGTARTDPRSDVYSLGATLYAALTGIIPEDGLDRATGKSRLTPVRELQPSIERKVATVIEKSLEIDPENRYQTAGAFRKALVEASDMSKLLLEELKITPPPVDPETSTLPFEPAEEDIVAELNRPSSKRRSTARRKRLGLLPFALIIILLSAVIGAVFIRPSLPFDVIALGQSPGPENLATTTTNILAANPHENTPTMSPTENAPAATPTPTKVLESINSELPTGTPTVTVTSTPSVTPVGGGLGQVVFASDRTGNNQIWLMNADGTGQQQLTNLPGGACQPDWSPDGMKLAFISPCDEKRNEQYPGSEIYIIDMNDKELVPHALEVSSEEGDFDPAWSPSGNRIAFTSLRVGTAHVFIYDFEEGSLQEISDTRFEDIHPAWNQDGTQIAVARKVVFHHIYILSDKGFTQYQLSSNGDIEDYWPDWSPGGNTIIFSRNTQAPSVPFLVGLDIEARATGQEARIPPLGQEEVGPVASAAFSFDGEWIVFESWPDGRNHDIFIMSKEGSDVSRLTTDPGFDFDPSWRPSPE